jgi:TRAP-type C4-dicarboxylate transport system permease small subunit
LGLSIRWVYVSVTVGLSLMGVHVIADLIARFGPEFRNNIDLSGACATPSGELD